MQKNIEVSFTVIYTKEKSFTANIPESAITTELFSCGAYSAECEQIDNATLHRLYEDNGIDPQTVDDLQWEIIE